MQINGLGLGEKLQRRIQSQISHMSLLDRAAALLDGLSFSHPGKSAVVAAHIGYLHNRRLRWGGKGLH